MKKTAQDIACLDVPEKREENQGIFFHLLGLFELSVSATAVYFLVALCCLQAIEHFIRLTQHGTKV